MGGISSQNGHQSSDSSINPAFMPYAKDALKRSEDVGNQGYVPYMGMDVAVPQALVGAWQGAANRNAAFNTPGQAAPDVASSMPLTTQDGVQGFSSYGGYQDQLAQLQKNYPGLYDYIKSFSIDPVTGELGSRAYRHGTNPGGGGNGHHPGPRGGGDANSIMNGNMPTAAWYYTKNRDFIPYPDLYNNTYGTQVQKS